VTQKSKETVMQRDKHLLEPVHVAGTTKGEELALKKGREPGRGGRRFYRSARDSTGINPESREPILEGMPHIPPA
jgi:hypothetical protein